MRKTAGIICVALGILCLLGAIGFVIYNRWEDQSAAEASRSMVDSLKHAIRENEINPSDDAVIRPGSLPETLAEKLAPDMETVSVDGYDCIGILSIPVLELELPVLADWSYAKLKKAPCHYFGSYYTGDLVIAAHNYNAHFGRLSRLQEGDPILFTAADGTVYYYTVALQETLPANATEEMLSGSFPLSLYTCTPGGANRITIRCQKDEA